MIEFLTAAVIALFIYLLYQHSLIKLLRSEVENIWRILDSDHKENGDQDKHECQYCGAMVFGDDEECYMNPANRSA